MNIDPVKFFSVTLTYGKSKPADLEFLHDIVEDLNLLMNSGLKVVDKNIKITLKCVICDAPAKAMVKATKIYYGCDKCAQSGLWLGRMTYPDTQNILLRTDVSFRNQADEQHHHGLSPFCNLGVDMVSSFPID